MQEIQSTLHTFKSWTRQHNWPTVPGLRMIWFRRHENGVEACGAMLKVGKRVLLDESCFLEWVRSNGASAK